MCVCVCMCAHVFVFALLYLKVYIHMLVNSCDQCGSVVRCCPTPLEELLLLTSLILRMFTVCTEIAPCQPNFSLQETPSVPLPLLKHTQTHSTLSQVSAHINWCMTKAMVVKQVPMLQNCSVIHPLLGSSHWWRESPLLGPVLVVDCYLGSSNENFTSQDQGR